MEREPFQENRFQRFLRTVIAPRRGRAMTLVVILYFAGVLVNAVVFKANWWTFSVLVCLWIIANFMLAYTRICEDRYRRYQIAPMVDEVMARIWPEHYPAQKGHDVIQGEIVNRVDE